jgi:hypothetical protein
MPVTVRKKRRTESGKPWKIVEDSTGKVVGESDSTSKATRSAGYRNKAWNEKHKK